MNTSKSIGKHIVKRKISKQLSELIINQVLAKLEKRIVPWHMTKPKLPFALNFETGKDYTGLSWFMLNCLNQYDSPYYLSWEEVKFNKGKVKAGSKATYHCYYKSEFSIDGDFVNEALAKKARRQGTDITETFVLKKVALFHSSQIENIEFKQMLMPPNGFSTKEECDLLMTLMPLKPKLKFIEENVASYNGESDEIEIPRITQFEDNEVEFYKLLFPALIHWTGHKDRLAREVIVKNIHPKKKGYELEHLVGEIGASYLFGYVGVERNTSDYGEKYFSFWYKTLEENPKLLFQAIEEAEKAISFILEN